MSCEARTDRDGSWHCRRCNMFGDHDEKPECLTDKQIGSRAIGNIRRELVNGQKPPHTKSPLD